MKKLLILFVLLFALHGQAQNVINADCSITLTVTAAGSSVPFDNRRIGCTTWHMAYMSTGFTAVSIQMDFSADNAGAPAAWTIWPAGDVAGTLPLTQATWPAGITEAQITVYKYHPWVRVTLNSKTGTGTVRALAYGYKPWSGFDSSFVGAVVVDLGKIGGTVVPSTTIGTVAVAGENAAQWIKTYSAGGAVDAAAAAGSKLVPLQVVSTALPSLKADLTSVAGTATVTAGVSGLQAIGGPIADGTAVSGNPARIAGKDGAGLTQDIITDASGAISTTEAATGADAIVNTALSALVTGAGAAAGPQQTANLLFNGTTWDRFRSGGATGAAMVAGPVADGAAASGNPVRIGGKDGSGNTQDISTDTVGAVATKVAVTGADAVANDALSASITGAGATAGPPTSATLIFNGTTWDRVRSGGVTGAVMAAGAAADGAAVAGNPLLMAAQDGTNAQSVKSDSTGRLEVIGGAADAAAAAGNAVRMGGWDGTNVYTVKTTTGGVVATGIAATGADAVANDALSSAVSSTPAAVGPALSAFYLFNGTTWDRARSGAATGAAMVAGPAAAAATPAGNPLLTGGSDYTGAGGPYVRTLKVDVNGALTLGAVPSDMTVDLNKIGGTAVPSTTIGTATGAKGEATAQWIKTLSALSGLDGAAGAGSQQVPLVVVSTAVPNLKTDLSTLAGTAPVNAGVAGTLAVGGNVAAGAAPTTNPVPMGTFDGTNTERLRSDTTGRLIPSIAENTFAAQTGDGSTAVYNASIYGPLQHTAQLDIVVTDKTVATCTYNLEGSLTGVAGTFLTVSGGQDCSAAATKTVIFSVADRLVKYVRGTITLWTEGAGATPPTLTLTYAGAR